MDLVRDILIALEEDRLYDYDAGSPAEPFVYKIVDEGHSSEQVREHLWIMADAQLVTPENSKINSQPDGNHQIVSYATLRWDGHEFLSKVRKGEIWEQAK